jgi:hypothetical protein
MMYFRESISTEISSLHREQFGRLIVALSMSASGAPQAGVFAPLGAQ